MPALSPSLLPTLLLLPRQDRTTPTATSSAPEIANSSAERFLPSASSTGDAGNHSDQGNGDTRAGLWKYAIVIILAVSALFLTVRLLFIYRLRKARLLAFQEQQNLLHQRRQDRADAERARRAWTGTGGDSRRDSFDSFEEVPWERGRGQSGFDGLEGARMRGHEPPPPGYEETVAPPAAAAPPPPQGTQHRPSLFKRLFSSTSSILPHTASSFSPSTPPSNPPTSINLQPLSSSSRPSVANPSSFPASNITRSRASVEAEAVRRALADAGLLVVPPSLALRGSRRLSSTATSPPPSSSSPALSPDDLEAAARRERRERRERRRERRRRRREQEEEGFGLPTYSKERGEGEEVLQRGEGVKSDEEEEEGGSSGEEGESGSEDERGEGGRRRASTSAGAGGGGGAGEESAGPAPAASPTRPPPQA